MENEADKKRKKEKQKYRKSCQLQLMKCRYEIERWRKGWRCKPFPVIYLIPLSHFSFPFLSHLHPPSLNCISVSLKIKFSPVPSLSRSIISSIPSPFLPPSFFSFCHLSLPSKHDITLLPNSRYSPSAAEEKVKIYKTTIFRFMCHGQKKYNHNCVERLQGGTEGEIGRSRGQGREAVVFAVEMNLRKINYLIICVCDFICCLCCAAR